MIVQRRWLTRAGSRWPAAAPAVHRPLPVIGKVYDQHLCRRGEFTVPDDSFSEMMGYPADQLTDEYWFPWYGSINMGTSILISRP